MCISLLCYNVWAKRGLTWKTQNKLNKSWQNLSLACWFYHLPHLTIQKHCQFQCHYFRVKGKKNMFEPGIIIFSLVQLCWKSSPMDVKRIQIFWLDTYFFCFKIAVGRNVFNCSVVNFGCQKIGNVGLNTCDFCLKICFYVDHVIMGERNVVTC